MELFGVNYNTYEDEFCQVLQDLNKRFDFFDISTPRKSICNIEMFAVYGYIRTHKPDLVFESGIYKGRSSAILASALEQNKSGYVLAASITKEYNEPRLYSKQLPITIVYEAGEKAVNKIDKSIKNIMLIDGPKPTDAVCAATQIYQKSLQLNTSILFQHDVMKGPKRKRDNFELFAQNNKVKFSYVPENFYRKYKHMDASGKRDIENLGALIY